MPKKDSMTAKQQMTTRSSSKIKKGEQMKDNQHKLTSDRTKLKNTGKRAPDFTLMDVKGKTHKLSDYKGKKVYLKFWASWCSICLSTLPDTKELAAMKNKDYEVLTVVAPKQNNEKSEKTFKKWLSGTEYKNLPILLDSKGELLKAYGVRSYPTSAFIGSDGVLVKKHIGYMSKKNIEKTLKDIK